VVEGQEEALKREAMVFTRAARLRWENSKSSQDITLQIKKPPTICNHSRVVE
jgi:hypothetical protein